MALGDRKTRGLDVRGGAEWVCCHCRYDGVGFGCFPLAEVDCVVLGLGEGSSCWQNATEVCREAAGRRVRRIFLLIFSSSGNKDEKQPLEVAEALVIEGGLGWRDTGQRSVGFTICSW